MAPPARCLTMVILKRIASNCFGVIAALWALSCAVVAGPACTAGGNYGALDTSRQVNDFFLKRVKDIGISTIIRYYDWEQETLPGKTLTSRELALVKRNDLNIAVVFQHNSDKTATFETIGRGRSDARRSLELAQAFKQPSGSAIYFGVDGVDGSFKVDQGAATDRFGLN